MNTTENNQIKKDATDILLGYLGKFYNNAVFYVAGGAPRDWFFGKPVNDIDIYTSKYITLDLNSVTKYFRDKGFNVVHSQTFDKTSQMVQKNNRNKGFFPVPKYRNSNKKRGTSIKTVKELTIGFNNKTINSITFDIIQLEGISGFSDIFSTYDTDICMIGYFTNKLILSKAFNERKDDIKHCAVNMEIEKNLIDYAKVKHFPKLMKKYPEIKQFKEHYKSLDYKIINTMNFPGIIPQQIIKPTMTARKPNFINKCSNHEWKAIELVFNTVWNCKYCDMKKEDWENQRVPF